MGLRVEGALVLFLYIYLCSMLAGVIVVYYLCMELALIFCDKFISCCNILTLWFACVDFKTVFVYWSWYSCCFSFYFCWFLVLFFRVWRARVWNMSGVIVVYFLRVECALNLLCQKILRVEGPQVECALSLLCYKFFVLIALWWYCVIFFACEMRSCVIVFYSHLWRSHACNGLMCQYGIFFVCGTRSDIIVLIVFVFGTRSGGIVPFF